MATPLLAKLHYSTAHEVVSVKAKRLEWIHDVVSRERSGFVNNQPAPSAFNYGDGAKRRNGAQQPPTERSIIIALFFQPANG